MNYFDALDKGLCCGCTACASVCPVNCIDMQEDKDGFAYPVIDKDRCIDCGLCKKVCPFTISESLKNKASDFCYALLIQDERELMKSTSGGAFKAIVDNFCDNNYVVFGAEMCDDLSVRHTMAESIEDINKFRKSKYVQSNINNAYSLVKQSLKEGKKVLFSGTGCQVAGLRGFLQKDYDNLLTVDFVCHGVPSNKLFRKYLDYLEKKFKHKINGYQFREKDKKHNDLTNIKLNFDNGKEKLILGTYDIYYKAFLKDIMLMPSCYECKFTSTERTSDITIADFWGAEKINSGLNNKNGISLVIPNTQKGNTLIQNISNVELFQAKIESAIISNPNLISPSSKHPQREEFLELAREDFKKAVNLYCPISYKTRMKSIISRYMPKWMKRMIKKLLIRGK